MARATYHEIPIHQGLAVRAAPSLSSPGAVIGLVLLGLTVAALLTWLVWLFKKCLHKKRAKRNAWLLPPERRAIHWTHNTAYLSTRHDRHNADHGYPTRGRMLSSRKRAVFSGHSLLSRSSPNRQRATTRDCIDRIACPYPAEALPRDEHSASSVYSEYPRHQFELAGPSDTTVSSETDFQRPGEPVTEEFRRRHKALLAQGVTPSDIMLASDGSEGTNASTAAGGQRWPRNSRRYGDLAYGSSLTAQPVVPMKPQPLRIRKERLIEEDGPELGIGHLSKELN